MGYKGVLSKLYKLNPLFMAITATLAGVNLVLYVGRLFLNPVILNWLAGHFRLLEWVLIISSLVGAILISLSILRKAEQLPLILTKWTLLMDILDRLTNRADLESQLHPKTEAIYIDAEKLAENLKSQVIGQPHVCEDVAATVRRRLALQQRDKPIGVFLFAGPPGTGKTYFGKVLATTLKRDLVHIDMTQFANGGFATTSLFGSPKGYAGSDNYGKLTAALRDKPQALVLLDEFEKAHPSVHKNFLTAWNDGFITEASDGRNISTSQAIFVLTTNAAVEALAKISKDYANDADGMRSAADQALRTSGFAPEVLSRIDRIFVFAPLQNLDVARVAALQIEAMIKSYGLEISNQGIDTQVLLDLMDRQAVLGSAASSRDLFRAIEESMADSLIEAKQKKAKTVALKETRGKVQAVPVEFADNSQP